MTKGVTAKRGGPMTMVEHLLSLGTSASTRVIRSIGPSSSNLLAMEKKPDQPNSNQPRKAEVFQVPAVASSAPMAPPWPRTQPEMPTMKVDPSAPVFYQHQWVTITKCSKCGTEKTDTSNQHPCKP